MNFFPIDDNETELFAGFAKMSLNQTSELISIDFSQILKRFDFFIDSH